MKRCLQPRLWIALSFGIFAGLLMALSPLPMPTHVAVLPNDPLALKFDESGMDPFWLAAVSPTGRYLITGGRHGANRHGLHVWDRLQGFATPIIYRSDPDRALFSPDAKTLAFCARRETEGTSDVYLFELPTGRETSRHQAIQMDHVFFAPDGRLLTVKDGTVSELPGNSRVRTLDKVIDGFSFEQTRGMFAVYLKEDQRRLYSYATGAKISEFTVAGDLYALSDDGRVARATERELGVLYDCVIDTSTNHCRRQRNLIPAQYRSSSPDGQVVVSLARRLRHPWLAKWFPANDSDESFDLADSNTDACILSFPNAKAIQFSATGDVLAVMRADLAIDVYDFPLRKPWRHIAGIGLLTATSSWLIAWLWSCWRARRIVSSKGVDA